MTYDEYNKRLIESCKRLIAVNKTKIFFTDPVRVKLSASEIFVCYGCEVTVDEELKVMDIAEEWQLLKETNVIAGPILRQLHQRLNSIRHHAAIAM